MASALSSHIVDFTNKAIEMVCLIGWEHAADVLPTLIARLSGSRGGEESSSWRQPVDLVVMLRQLEKDLPALMEEEVTAVYVGLRYRS